MSTVDPGTTPAPAQPHGDPRDASIAELLKQLSQETTTLVKQELDLAKAEMTEKGKAAGIGVGMLVGAGVVALVMLGTLSATLVALLDLAMATWLAALIVTLLWAAVAGALALIGKGRLQQAVPPVPEQTIDTLKEDAQWAKTQPRSAAK